MGRILFFAALGLLGYWLFRNWQRKSDDEPQIGNKTDREISQKEGQTVLPCRYCGAYSPQDVGVMLEGRFYCNVEHAKANGEKVD